MKNKIKLSAKIGEIVSMMLLLILLTLMMFSTTAYAKVDVHIEQNEDVVQFIVENTGHTPAYVLNSLTVSDKNGHVIYTSQERSSAEVLRIYPGKKYIFEWDTADVPEGNYKGKIYQGDNVKKLKSISIDCIVKPKPKEPIFFTDERFYKYGENVSVIFKNNNLRTVYVNVNNWRITNLDTRMVVRNLSIECSFGYGGCFDLFEPLKFRENVTQTWDQKDNSGRQVAFGKYMVTAEYSYRDPASGMQDIKNISTKTFFIRPPEKHK